MTIGEGCLTKDLPTNLCTCDHVGGTYALVHSTLVTEDYYDKNIVAYGQEYTSFKVFQDSLLIEWNCKMTSQIFRWKSLHYAKSNRKHLKPTIAVIRLSQIKETIIGIPDHKCEIPFGYLFMPCKKTWNKVLMDYVQDFTNHDNMSQDDSTKNDNSNNDASSEDSNSEESRSDDESTVEEKDGSEELSNEDNTTNSPSDSSDDFLLSGVVR